VVDAKAALSVYLQAWAISDRAYADPSKDWESMIRQSIADPYAALVLESLRSMSESHLRTTGANILEARVTMVQGSGDGTKVSIDACLDSSGTDLLDADGRSVKVDLDVGPRIRQTANVYKYPDKDGAWLLSEANAYDPYEPC
jgi:hypothetical protein